MCGYGFCRRSMLLPLCAIFLLLITPLHAGPPQRTLWPTNVPVSEPEAAPQHPAVAVDQHGRVYVTWHDARPGALQGIYVTSRPVGGAWTTPKKIPSSDAGPPSTPTIAAGTAGTVYVAWVRGFPETRADILFAWSIDGGNTWQGPEQVNTDPHDIAGDPALAVDSRGNVHLVWSDLAVFGDAHSRDIKWAMRLAGQATWTAPALVHPDVTVFTEQARPAITADGLGNVYAIWEDARHGPDDPFAIYAARLPAGAIRWEPGRRVDHRPGEINLQPDIAATHDGTLYAVWDARTERNVYAAVLRPETGVWEEPISVLDERQRASGQLAGLHSSVPRIAVDRRGIAYAVWQDRRNGNPDVYAAVRWPGAGEWGRNMRVNDDTGPATQAAPAIAARGAGRGIVVWEDQRHAGQSRVYVAELQLAVRDLRLPLITR